VYAFTARLSIVSTPALRPFPLVHLKEFGMFLSPTIDYGLNDVLEPDDIAQGCFAVVREAHFDSNDVPRSSLRPDSRSDSRLRL
jgi:hypothetical protein